MPCTPSLPSSGQRSRGKLLLRSISSARGAICAAAKLRTLSRRISAVSPSPKLNPPRPPASMGVLANQPPQNVGPRPGGCNRIGGSGGPGSGRGGSGHPARSAQALAGSMVGNEGLGVDDDAIKLLRCLHRNVALPHVLGDFLD